MAVTVRALTASLGCEALKRGMASMMARGVTKAEALADREIPLFLGLRARKVSG